MGSVKPMIPQGPNVHCGNPELHDQHTNQASNVFANAYCDGVPPLEGFAELTVRVPLTAIWMEEEPHQAVLKALHAEGMWSVFEDYYESPEAITILRLRTTNDGIDKMYRLGEGT